MRQNCCVTERKKYGVTFESFVDKQIREAQERGAFENLDGAGKPIPRQSGPHDELWWVKGFLQRENLSTDVLLPTSLQLRKEVEKLPATLIEIRFEDSVREALNELNTRIVDWIRFPSPPLIPIAPVDVEDWVARWKTNRAAMNARRTASATSSSSIVQPEVRPARWWRRRFGRGAR